VTADRSAGAATGREARSLERRQRLLDATRELLRQDGWHNVAISDIGAAAGISGPAVYRHFRSKEELLVAALDHAAGRLWSGLPDDDGRPAPDLLVAYVDSHVAFAVENSDIIELWYQEARHLPKPARTAQRRLQRRYIERWNDVLLECRPRSVCSTRSSTPTTCTTATGSTGCSATWSWPRCCGPPTGTNRPPHTHGEAGRGRRSKQTNLPCQNRSDH
jgi:AcrR family transcriptional regulator